jgi:hypothetical protein
LFPVLVGGRTRLKKPGGGEGGQPVALPSHLGWRALSTPQCILAPRAKGARWAYGQCRVVRRRVVVSSRFQDGTEEVVEWHVRVAVLWWCSAGCRLLRRSAVLPRRSWTFLAALGRAARWTRGLRSASKGLRSRRTSPPDSRSDALLVTDLLHAALKPVSTPAGTTAHRSTTRHWA